MIEVSTVTSTPMLPWLVLAALGVLAAIAAAVVLKRTSPFAEFSVREHVTIYALIFAFFALFAGSIGGFVRTDVSKIEEAREVVAATFESETQATGLAPVNEKVGLCYEGSEADAALYAWEDASGSAVSGILKKSAEENGSCSYALIPN